MDDNKQKTVLVVDDDPDWRDFVCRVLGERYPVQFATNGDDALVKARELKPALIVMDVMMPRGRDGFSALCALKGSDETKAIPVIILSEVNAVIDAAFDKDQLAAYLGAAPTAFLEKPVSPGRLKQEVSKALGETA